MASSLVNNKYRITRRIGGGSFGEIYMGVGPNNEKVAVKFERHGARCPQLRHEYKVYRELTNCHGFCSVYHFGIQDNYNVMVMDLLGPSLEDLFNKCNRRFSLKTVLQLADQLLERVDTLHSRHLIHRDIKPANFVIGVGEQAANVYCVDFGLSKRYRHPKNLQHIPHRDGRSLTGTPRYASINNHLGIEQSRRDDLESIGYVLIYFLKGTLPWQGLKAKNAQKKYRLIMEKKQQVSIAQLCQGCPSQFAEFLAYTRSLKFDAKPDIPYLRKLFRDLYHAQGCASVPKLWDWDGMEPADYLSAGGGSAAGGAGTGQPIIVQPGAGTPSGQGHVRPTTAAAVGGGLESDLMGQDTENDFEHGGQQRINNGRPNTAGAGGYRSSTQAQNPSWAHNMQSGIAAQQQQQQGGMFGNSGQPAPDPQSRRPHTAHGARGTGAPAVSGGGGVIYTPGSGSGGGGDGSMEEGDAVVAGARGMMRYRRNRASTIEGTPASGGIGQQQVPVQQQQQQRSWEQQQTGNSAGWGGGSGSRGQSQGYPQQQQQGGIIRGKPSGSSGGSGAQQSGAVPSIGWPSFSGDRPKSAGIAGAPQPNGGGSSSGLMASLTGGGRPSSSNTGFAGAQWGSQNGGAQQQAGGAGQNNALSYGSLKTRFLSGSTNGKPTQSSGTGAPAVGGGSSGSGKQSKLFSLAR